MHYPSPEGWTDAIRDRTVSYIGSPYDNRRDFLLQLSRERGPAIFVNGGLWENRLPKQARGRIVLGGPLIDHDYREAIWRSTINLSFVTHSNLDETARKSVEIAACGGFLLAERTPAHARLFKEGEEAAFFSSVEECFAQIQRYIPDEVTRTRIARAGRQRAMSSGYDNDSQMAKVVEHLREWLRLRNHSWQLAP
jgi:hypothetical protein